MEYRYTIKELPEEERPREKLIKHGARALSNAELLALIIRTGNKKRTAVELSQDILNFFGGLEALNDISVEEITRINGVGLAKGAQIQATVELSKRLFKAGKDNRPVVKSPGDVAELVMPDMRYLKQEVFKIILFDIKNQLIAISEISRGGLSSSIVHPREVFKEAIRRSSAAVILVHNHPSGDPSPSDEDINVTRRLVDSGKILGVDVLDHIIIGDGVYLSMKKENLI
ncbi:RadC family protein [Halothermothrix orenii]|uniref:DNA repair protein RadC n=1 Tax=Halothermothrix orenii (strain H 168 / OCM 544 / DSM 9562) TaxID=373903 RepID=B8CY05_HALOH|nr:DNA repair protein RadC [Halothermothrix orenii H 168]